MKAVHAVLTVMTLGALMIAGCSPASDQPELREASGYVTMDGEPLADVVVLFGPEEGRSSFAYTDENGYFEMMYLPDVPGAMIGSHKVSIMPAVEEEEEPDPDAESIVDPIPAIYNSETTLTAEVTADGENEFRFELKSNESVFKS